MRWTMYEYNHDARTQSPRPTAARLQLAVGRRGLGPREQGDQRTQRASFVARYHAASVHTEKTSPALSLGGLHVIFASFQTLFHTNVQCTHIL